MTRPFPTRPRLADHVLARRHITGGDAVIVLHDQHTGRQVLPWLPSVELSDAQWGDLKNEVSPTLVDTTPGRWALPHGFPSPTAGVRGLHQDRLVALIRNGPPLLFPGGI